MQFTRDFASACAVTIPVLSLAAVVDIRAARRKPVKVADRHPPIKISIPIPMPLSIVSIGLIAVKEIQWAQATELGWFLFQLASLVAELICLWGLASPAEFSPGGVLGWTALGFVTLVIAVQMLLLTVRPTSEPEAAGGAEPTAPEQQTPAV